MEMMMDILPRGGYLYRARSADHDCPSRLEQFNSVPTLLDRAGQRRPALEEAMDIGLAVIFGLPAAVVILLCHSPENQSRAPVFYSGRVGRPHFRLYKLRTMIPDAENTGPVLAAG